MKTLYQGGVRNYTGTINLCVILVCKNDLITFNLNLADFLRLGHGHKRAIVHFAYRLSRYARRNQRIKEKDQQQNNDIIENQWLFWALYFLHFSVSVPYALSVGCC